MNEDTPKPVTSDIQQIVEQETRAIAENGRLREMVRKALEKSIEDAIEQALRSYSDFGKALSQKVKTAVGVELNNVNLQTAVLGLGHLVEGQVNRYVTEQTHPMLLKTLDELFKPAPASIELEALLNEYQKSEEDEALRDNVERFTLLIETSEHDAKDITIALSPTTEKGASSYLSTSKSRIAKAHECEIQMHLRRDDTDPTVYIMKWIYFGGHRSTTTKDFLPTALWGFARRLYQLYAAGTRLIVPSLEADQYETHYDERC